MVKSQVSNHLLAGGYALNHHSTQVQASSSMTQLLVKLLITDLQIAKMLMSGPRDKQLYLKMLLLDT
jgi:hypothetical protein